MKCDLYAFGPALTDAGALAREAEELGLDGLWFTETSHNPYLACAAAALATERIEIGTDIAVAFPRSPMVTAQVAWDLAQASGGRFVLGLGTQVRAHIERRFSSEFSRPAARLREYVLALRAIFTSFQTGERLRFAGDFYSFSLLPEFFDPGPIDHPDVPVYLAGVNPGLARVAGEVADGFHVHPFHSAASVEQVIRPALAEGAAAVGRSPSQVRLAAPVFTIVADDEEDQERQRSAVRRQLAFYGSTPTYRSVFEVHGWDDTAERLQGHMRQGDLDAMDAEITDDMLAVYAVTAGWDDLAEALRSRYEGGVDRIFPYPVGTDADDPERRRRWAEVARTLRET